MIRRKASEYAVAMRLMRVSLVLVLAALVDCGPALAGGKVYAPPGKAGTSEYSEIVPSAGGNVRPPADGGGNATGAQISKLGAGAAGVRKLTKLGKNGAAAAKFAEQTAPAVQPAKRRRPATGAGNRVTPVLRATNASAVTAVTRLVGGSDSGGIGLALPLLLAFSLGAAVAVAGSRLLRGR